MVKLTRELISTWQFLIRSKSFGVFNLENHPTKKNGNGGVVEVRLMREGKPNYLFFPGGEFKIEMDYAGLRPDSEVSFRIVIKDSYFQSLINISNNDLGLRLQSGKTGTGTVKFSIDSLPMYGDGTYYIDFSFGEENKSPIPIENAITFKMEP